MLLKKKELYRTMNIDIICPLYNAEKDIENLHKSLLKQKNVQINEVK